MIYIKEIINYSSGHNVDIIRKMIIKQNNISVSKIYMFMKIQKKDNNYICYYKNKVTNKTTFKKLSMESVKQLLPKCIIKMPDKIEGGCLDVLYENTHELDESDIFFIDMDIII